MVHIRDAVIGTILCSALAAGAADATCPASEMSYDGVTSFTSTAPVLDSTAFSSGDAGIRFAYNLPLGEVEVHHCCGLGVVSTRARDAFDIVGVTPGTPVTVSAQMHIEGWILALGCGGSGCWGNLEGSITADQTRLATRFTEHLGGAGRTPISGLVRLQVTIVAGTPKTIEFALAAWRAAGGNHGAQGIGRIRFSGLPPGARIVSCNGYDSIVPTQPVSWGRLKTIYR